MVRPQAETESLRFSRSEKDRLLIALFVSLVIHLGAWGGYEAGRHMGLWQKIHWPFQKKTELKPVQQPPVAKVEPPIFLDVAEPSTEVPKNAKYYSANNSVAAQTQETKPADQPKIDGKQKYVPKTEDVPKPVKAPPAKPVTPQPPVEPKPAQNNNPANSLHAGTLDQGNPQDKPEKSDKPAEQPERPRTLREALAQRTEARSGLQMQQEGGVRRHAAKVALDSLSTTFGAYDDALVEAVRQRWYDLLDSQKFALDRTGKVTVTFHLNPDGSITETKIAGNSVGELLGYVCQEAIEQAAPFGKWPDDMRRLVGGNFREMTFTFYYY